MFRKKRLKTFMILAVLGRQGFPMPAAAEGPAPAALRQCYEWAKARSADLKVREEDIQQSQDRAGSLRFAAPG